MKYIGLAPLETGIKADFMKSTAIFATSVICSALTLHAAETAPSQQAVAVFTPSGRASNGHGIVRFTETRRIREGGRRHLEGLTPGQKHAFHIHQYGDLLAPDGMSAGGTV